MNKDDLAKLVSEIEALRDAYWKGDTRVPDSVYDAKIELLRQENPNHPLLTGIEHNGQVIGDTVRHKRPMLSLEKVYSEADLFAWVRNISRNDNEVFLIQPKYDGVSCHFNNGVYATRGDGETGQNITAVCRDICRMETNGSKDDFYGELVIKKSVFNSVYQNIKNGSGRSFKNSRNAVAGILGTDDFSFYSKQGATITLVDYDKNSYTATKGDFELKWSIYKSIITALDFPLDGIVVKLQDKDYSESRGYTSHHPKGQIAFKFDNQVAETRLIDIEYGMGREQLTAVAIFAPVEIGGVEIRRAVVPLKSRTLPCVLNGDFTKDALLVVERAGDVIPHIVDVRPSASGDKFNLEKCPFCGSPIDVSDSSVACSNNNCKEKKVQKLIAGLKELGLKNVGEASIRKIADDMALKYGESYIDLNGWMMWFGSCDCLLRLESIPGFGRQSAINTLEEVNKIRSTTHEKFIASLCIPGVGTKIATEIMRVISFDDLLDASADKLSGIPSVGNLMAERISGYFANNKAYVSSILPYLKFPANNAAPSQTSCGTVCFTGAMRMPRRDMCAAAISNGFTPVDSVSRGLDILVIADSSDRSSSKCRKAEKYGTKIMSESEFFANLS